ncbi:DNA mismatch repair endonuclease MutL [Alteromonas lipotrueiana]|uniref:DNA mismatch repair endonuclease MutL n=1 Tax=Alteromonas lipotrueiana TaxID=2803815 RepID=UPI001C48B860|nr:DNA mismatch repair endonuclease MutL [Alteromonas lipotrueiana]
MPIQLLPPQLANQIAAGEVVERPASVVKELVENSLDAGATRIELEIERGGHKRIKLKDNGNGIAKDELQLALSRHATSKIATLDDLEKILSLGFRGEALASISSVSRLTLTSKPKAQPEAWQACCEGREMQVSVTPAAHPDGTTIDVADLFYNTPARRKFLRTEKTEFQHIEDVLRRIALSHPTVSFTLKHNGKTIKRYTVSGHQPHRQRIAQVVGQKFVDNAIHVELDYQGMAVEAYLGNDQVMRSSNDCQFSFVNGRGMRDKLILHAIRQAYETVYASHEQPAFVFYLTVEPKEVDVNVHPAKHEVRFQQSRLVHDFIVKTVADALMPSEQGHYSEEPEHDYIRPLSSTANEPSFRRDTFTEPHTAAQPEPSNFGSRDFKVGHNPGAGSGLSGSFGRSRGAGRMSSRKPAVSETYQAQYNQLMNTPNADENDPSFQFSMLSVSPHHRLISQCEQVWLLSVDDLLMPWWQSLLNVESTSQPLLMPVAIENRQVFESTISLLNELGFVINRAAGKVRLQQVPAGSRHLPWVALFPAIMSVDATQKEALARKLANLSIDWPASVFELIWQWFDVQAQAKRWAWIQEFGKVRTLESLVQQWDNPDV